MPVEFLRGKDRRTVSVVTEDEPDMFTMRLPAPRRMRFAATGPTTMPDAGRRLHGHGPGRPVRFHGRIPLGDLELAPLNPDLGPYFGTTDGVLVISAPKDGTLGLKGGDVVQAVDGRKPSGPSHLMRILRSYDRGKPSSWTFCETGSAKRSPPASASATR